MLKQNQRSEKTSQKITRFRLNKSFLVGVIVCFLSISLMSSASAKELRINLTESLDMSNNDKKPKDFAQKVKPKEKAKPDKKEVKKPEKPKPKLAVKKLADVKKKPTDTVPKKSTAVKTKPAPTKNVKTK